jgi:hypothetical protein
VIVNRDASIAKEVENHGIGVAVQNAHEVSAALQCVQENYQRFSDSALMFFDEHLDFRRAFTEVLRRVDALQ